MFNTLVNTVQNVRETTTMPIDGDGDRDRDIDGGDGDGDRDDDGNRDGGGCDGAYGDGGGTAGNRPVLYTGQTSMTITFRLGRQSTANPAGGRILYEAVPSHRRVCWQGCAAQGFGFGV